MEFEIIGNMLVKFSSSEYDAYIIMSVVDTCLCIESYGYKDDYLRENNYEDQHLDLIIGTVYRVFEEWNLNQIFFMSLAEIKEVLQIAKFMFQADNHAVQNLETISGYSRLEMSQTFDTLERAFLSFSPMPRAHGPMLYTKISNNVINIDMNAGDFFAFHQFFFRSFRPTPLLEELIKHYGYDVAFANSIEKIYERSWREFEERRSITLSKLEVQTILQVLRFIFISERSHAFPDSYKNQVISIIEGLEQALYYFELE